MRTFGAHLVIAALSMLFAGCGTADHYIVDSSFRSSGAAEGGGVGSGGGTSASNGGSGGAQSESSGGSAGAGLAGSPKLSESLPGLCDSSAGESAYPLLPIDATQAATRLSKLFWNIAPPEYLVADAKTRNLKTLSDLACFAQSMLNDPRAAAGVSKFFLDWLDTGVVPSLARDPKLFPEFTAETVVNARASTQAFLGHVFFPNPNVVPQPATLSTLLTAKFGYVNQPLSKILGVPSTASALEFVDVLPNRRIGLLSQAYFPMVEANATSSSPTRRGSHLIETFLCNTLPRPPLGVVTTPPNPVSPLTTRARYESQHAVDPGCRSCHQLMDQPGFAFEHFDADGSYRMLDANQPVESMVTLPRYSFRDWGFGPVSVSDHASLSELLAKSEAVRACLSARWIAHAEAVIWDQAAPSSPMEVKVETISYVLRRGKYSAGASNDADPNYFDLKQMMLAVIEQPVTYAALPSLR